MKEEANGQERGEEGWRTSPVRDDPRFREIARFLGEIAADRDFLEATEATRKARHSEEDTYKE